MEGYIFEGRQLDRKGIRDIAPEVLDENSRLRVLPSAYWATTTRDERALFGNTYGIYGFPTTELVQYIKDIIQERKAIEIGAGHGVLAEALGIPATDSMAQLNPRWREVYEATGQALVPYGPNVEDGHASRAVRRHQPEVVVASWVTHKWDPTRPLSGGFEEGVDEEDILRNCKEYVFIGNERVHKDKSIWRRPHIIVYPDFVYSRSSYGKDFIAIWRGLKRSSNPLPAETTENQTEPNHH